MRPAFEKAVTVKHFSVRQGHLYTEYSVGGPIALSHKVLMR
jgi:hypothetical protein